MATGWMADGRLLDLSLYKQKLLDIQMPTHVYTEYRIHLHLRTHGAPFSPHQRPRQTWYDLLVVTILIMRVHLSSFFAWTFSIKRVINQNTHSNYTRGAFAIKKQAQHAQGEDTWVGWCVGG